MARIKDVPVVLKEVGVVPFALRVWKQINEDNILAWGAALAYSWLFAIFPFLIFLLTMVPMLPLEWRKRAHVEIAHFIYQLPVDAADLLWENLHGLLSTTLYQQHAQLLSIGLLITLWAAAGGMAMTMSALDKCYEVVKFRPFYLQRFIAIVMTIVVAVLMILVVTLLPVAGLLKAWMLGKGFLQEGDFLLIAFDVVRWLLSLLLMFTMLSLIYFWGPSIRQKWQSITPGAVFCVVVWIVLGLAFRFYINKFAHYEKTYGTVGGVAVLLLFFYIDAVVLLIGAEINSEIDFAIGVPRGASDFRGAILQAAAKRLQEKGQIPPDAKPEPQELKAEAAKVIQTLKREGEADLLQPEKKVEELKEKVDDAARKN